MAFLSSSHVVAILMSKEQVGKIKKVSDIMRIVGK